MTVAAKQALRGFRNDPFYESFIFSGIDLTGASFAFAVRSYPDQAGAALISFSGTTTPGGEGVRLVEVDEDEDGIPESLIEVVATKAHMQALPAAAEAGDPVVLYYELQVTPPADGETPWYDQIEQTWLYGDFILNGSANS